MPTEWELQRQKLSAAAAKAVAELFEHMGLLDSFIFELDDGRQVTVKVSKKKED
jgi:hypothetical protein